MILVMFSTSPYRKMLQFTPENKQPCKRERKKSSLGLNQSRKKNEKYVNTLMKENPQKYTQVYADKSLPSEVSELNEGEIRRKRKLCCEARVQDNEKSTQVFLCCGQEIKLADQQCQLCSRKRVNVVETGMQAHFVDIDGYVDERLQQLLQFTQEKSNTHSNNCTAEVSSTPENDSCDITLTDGMSVTHDNLLTYGNVCQDDNSLSGRNIERKQVCVDRSCQTDITTENCDIKEKRPQFGPKTFRCLCERNTSCML